MPRAPLSAPIRRRTGRCPALPRRPWIGYLLRSQADRYAHAEDPVIWRWHGAAEVETVALPDTAIVEHLVVAGAVLHGHADGPDGAGGQGRCLRHRPRAPLVAAHGVLDRAAGVHRDMPQLVVQAAPWERSPGAAVLKSLVGRIVEERGRRPLGWRMAFVGRCRPSWKPMPGSGGAARQEAGAAMVHVGRPTCYFSVSAGSSDV